MGLRFQKRIKIAPGLWINLSKSGISTSLGGKGVTVNLKGRKAKATVGIPGTGISYSKEIRSDTLKNALANSGGFSIRNGLILLLLCIGFLVVYFLLRAIK